MLRRNLDLARCSGAGGQSRWMGGLTDILLLGDALSDYYLDPDGVVVTARVRGCSGGRTSAGRFRASARTWKRKVPCGQSGRDAGAACSSSVRRDRSRPPLCRWSGGCAGERPRCTPATNRCGWPGNGSQLGCAHARHGHFRPNGRPRSKRQPGGSDGKGRSTPSGHWPLIPRSSKVRPVPAHRPFRQAKASHSVAGGLGLFFEPAGDGLSRHAEDSLGRPQSQSLNFHRPQDQLLARGVGGRTLGNEHPVRSTRFAEILLGASGVVTAFDDSRAGARRAAGNRRFHAHSSPRKSALSLAQLPLPELRPMP